MCTALAPELFRLDDGGKAVVMRNPASTAEEAALEEAVALCPAQAIRPG
jgi:ferredoxin